MSLINDALKRASRAPKPPEAGAPLLPVGAPRAKRALPGWLLTALLAVVVVAAGWCVWRAWRVTPAGPAANSTNAAPARPVSVALSKAQSASNAIGRLAATLTARTNESLAATSPEKPTGLDAVAPTNAAPPLAAVPGSATAPAGETPRSTITNGPTPDGAAAQNPTIASSTNPVAKVAERPATAAEFPPLKLEAIYYRVKNPSAMIDGETVYVGDIIEGVRVAKIDQQTVTLTLGGRTKALTLNVQ